MFCCRARPALRRSFLLASILIAPRVSRGPALYIMWYVVTVVTVWCAQCTGTASELRNRIFMCWIFGLAARGSGDCAGRDMTYGGAGSLHATYISVQTRACKSLPFPGQAPSQHFLFLIKLIGVMALRWKTCQLC